MKRGGTRSCRKFKQIVNLIDFLSPSIFDDNYTWDDSVARQGGEGLREQQSTRVDEILKTESYCDDCCLI